MLRKKIFSYKLQVNEECYGVTLSNKSNKVTQVTKVTEVTIYG